MLRIDRVLSNRGYCARSDTKDFLKEHDVRIVGTRLTRPDTRVPEDDVVVDGEQIDPTLIYLLMHKPLGLVCAHKPEDGNDIVYSLIPPRWTWRAPPITTVGRLDKETSGLLILTDDGDLVHRLTSPKYHVPRVYVAELEKPLKGDEAALFASGTMVLPSEGDEVKGKEPKPLLPADLEAIDPTHARLTLREGRYHQIRRMFAATGNCVVKLHRESFGPLKLDDSLAAGMFRTMSSDEVAMMNEAWKSARVDK